MTKCLECDYLREVFQSRLGKYRAARSAALYRICTEFAAKQQVDMERAKNDLEEHVLVCPLSGGGKAVGPVRDEFEVSHSAQNLARQ